MPQFHYFLINCHLPHALGSCHHQRENFTRLTTLKNGRQNLWVGGWVGGGGGVGGWGQGEHTMSWWSHIARLLSTLMIILLYLTSLAS